MIPQINIFLERSSPSFNAFLLPRSSFPSFIVRENNEGENFTARKGKIAESKL